VLLGVLMLISIYLALFHGTISSATVSEGAAFQVVQRSLKRHFPAALPASQMVMQADEALIAQGFDVQKTLFAESTCPDEINHQSGGILDLFRSHWGNAEFFLGGLAGIPFSGRAGFGAFSHHVPEEGTILLLFAPHVSVDEDGTVGKYHRKGQSDHSTACGAAIAAFTMLKDALLNGGRAARDEKLNKAQNLDPHDYQIQFITSKINVQLDKIMRSKEPIVALTMELYEVIQKFVMEIINLDHKIALLGGVQVNIPLDSMEDHFLPLYFKVHEKDKEPVDLIAYVDEQLEAHPHPLKRRTKRV